MKVTVYKGFDEKYLSSITERPIIESNTHEKINVLAFDKQYKKQLQIALISLKETDDVWMTYEEFSIIQSSIEDAIKDDGLQVMVIGNNLYPDYYPVPFDISDSLYEEIQKTLSDSVKSNEQLSEECERYVSVYNSLLRVGDVMFGSFYNYEYYNEAIKTVKFYQQKADLNETVDSVDYSVFINDDIDSYLRDLVAIMDANPQSIGVNYVDSNLSLRILSSLQVYCHAKSVSLYKHYEPLQEDLELETELKRIATDEINIEGFVDFKKLKFYKNPDISKEIIEISQARIIEDIIRQAENSYVDKKGNGYRDIFITASTGAGKSVMFQIPAVYLAQKYKKLTIIIEPVKALMQDQKEKLIKSGFNRVETFNSDLISQVEKEAVLNKIKNGEVDLLYLSPETLLSYSIDTIIGDREIGLLIVDEAHIVTTWGIGFRPDYWYLGSYINRLRNQIQTYRGKMQRIYHFPVCAFTATAINGGIDDSVGETVISLYMENPIKYIGYVKRDDISFEIAHKGNGLKMGKTEYEENKCHDLDERVKEWIEKNEKTIVYFPYASLAFDAANGSKEFVGITRDPKRIGVYTGRNIDDKSIEVFKEDKKRTFEGFKDGSKPIMFATKAFGMGVDVKDVKNVYHYAASGNLCDYVQEIGRAARAKGMNGYAITDYYKNDMNFIRVLFGMSRIKRYQVIKVLEGIYSTYKSKNENRNFLISPESFTYIFNGKSEGECINKLKTCLLMLEKDLYDKYNFKVLISRPQGVFTKAFICVQKEYETKVLSSKYASCFKFVKKGKYKEKQIDGSLFSDLGDIYDIDLKSIWEQYHPNLSFPQFKYYFFTPKAAADEGVAIMPEIREYVFPRERITIEAKGDSIVGEIRDKILADFDYIADTLYASFGKQYFKTDDFRKIIKDKFGESQARIIANSLFDLVDPDGKCVKHRLDNSGKMLYSLSNGNFKAMLRNPIIKSSVVNNMAKVIDDSTFSDYISISSSGNTSVALKLMSIFNYITYEVAGGEEPEIFVRLNDPNKIRSIVNDSVPYSNDYVIKAQKKHERDVQILNRFFNVLKSDKERWDYIEDYFLGYDVLNDVEPESEQITVPISKVIDKNQSYSTALLKEWKNIYLMFDDEDALSLKELEELKIPIPDYLATVLKKTDEGKSILMTWLKNSVIICDSSVTDKTLEYFERKGWNAYRIDEIDTEKIQGELL